MFKGKWNEIPNVNRLTKLSEGMFCLSWPDCELHSKQNGVETRREDEHVQTGLNLFETALSLFTKLLLFPILVSFHSIQ